MDLTLINRRKKRALLVYVAVPTDWHPEEAMVHLNTHSINDLKTSVPETSFISRIQVNGDLFQIEPLPTEINLKENQ